VPEVEPQADITRTPAVLVTEPIFVDEEERILECMDWVAQKGLPEPELEYELVDEATGEPLAVFDMAWPEELQPGFSPPTAILLNEPREVEEAANCAAPEDPATEHHRTRSRRSRQASGSGRAACGRWPSGEERDPELVATATHGVRIVLLLRQDSGRKTTNLSQTQRRRLSVRCATYHTRTTPIAAVRGVRRGPLRTVGAANRLCCGPGGLVAGRAGTTDESENHGVPGSNPGPATS
jgi:hypothetical protein